ncbi:hypothetical protein ABT300_40855 [Streptomyces sp. NPDC001027]|uniref:MmyB family transcriptional regulator n=1 Tax=Streptomyces sp. NPDC001027 TaxID=3154771 RepID=UPI00332FE10E
MAPHERNYIRMLFTDPRMKAVDNPKDPRLVSLVGELSVHYPLFRQWRASRHVASQNFGSKTIHHPTSLAAVI